MTDDHRSDRGGHDGPHERDEHSGPPPMVFVEPAQDDAPVVSVRRGAGLIWIMGVIMGAMLVGGAVLVLNYFDMRAQANDAIAQRSTDAATIANLQRDNTELKTQRDQLRAKVTELETAKTTLESQLGGARQRARRNEESQQPFPRPREN